MKYKIEIYSNGQLTQENIVLAQNNRQAVSKEVNKIEKRGYNLPKNLMVLVMNQDGQIWIYSMQYDYGRYHATKINKPTNLLNSDNVNLIMANMVKIKRYLR